MFSLFLAYAAELHTGRFLSFTFPKPFLELHVEIRHKNRPSTSASSREPLVVYNQVWERVYAVWAAGPEDGVPVRQEDHPAGPGDGGIQQ